MVSPPSLSPAALEVLERRYLRKDENGQTVETPDQMFHRVAVNIAAISDAFGDRGDEVEEFYQAMRSLEFLPNSPTLMNAGTNIQQLSACFVIPVEDSIESIYDAVKYGAIVQQTGGGCISGNARVYTTFCGLEPISVLFKRATADGRTGNMVGSGYAVDVKDLNIKIAAMDPLGGPICFKRMTHVWRYDVPLEHQIVVITKEGSRIQTSDWHPFMVFRDGSLVPSRADKLRPKDVIIGPTLNDEVWPWKSPYMVKGINIDEGLGWLTGLTLGDGSFGQYHGKKSLRLGWFSRRVDVLNRVREELARYNIRVKLNKDARGLFNVTTCTKWFILTMMDICNISITEPKDLTTRIPETISKSPLSVIRSFIAGLLDSDGCVDKEGSPSFNTASKEMSEDLSALLSILGYRPTVKRREPSGKGKNPTYTISMCPLNQVNQFEKEIGKYMSSVEKRKRLEAPTFKRNNELPIPRSWFNDILRRYQLKGPKGKKEGSGLDARELDYWSARGEVARPHLKKIAYEVEKFDPSITKLWLMVAENGQQVKSIEHASRHQPFYDLTVEEWNTYLAGEEGLVLVHNTGYSFSKIRPEGDPVRSTGGVASGPVSFMKVFDAATDAIKQGGRRRGANMGVLRVDHPDIDSFIAAKKDLVSFSNFNLSIAVTDEFMDRASRGEEFDLVHPRDGRVVRSVSAAGILERIAISAWWGGDPGVLFIDAVNRGNPLPALGPIEATNPCGEVPLLPFEACNLGSINLDRMVTAGEIDWIKLAHVVDLGVRFLDNVIDANRYPLVQTAKVVRGNRKIGLGIMGFADMLVRLKVRYGSPISIELTERLMSFVRSRAEAASRSIAESRGSFPNIGRSNIDGPRRNATVLSIAPTGTISMIAGCSSGIEPYYAIAYSRKVMDGRHLEVMVPLFSATACEYGLMTPELARSIGSSPSIKDINNIPREIRELFVTGHDVPVYEQIDLQATVQRHVDNAVSKTVNLPPEGTWREVYEAIVYAHSRGCKGLTVYREGSKPGQVLTTIKDARNCRSCGRFLRGEEGAMQCDTCG